MASAAITTRAQTTSAPYNDGNLTVTVTNAQGTSGSDVTVTTQYQLSLITPLGAISRLLPGGSGIANSFTLSSTTVMRIE